MSDLSLPDLLVATSGGGRVEAPDELVQAIERLGFNDAFVGCCVTESFNVEEGVSTWHVTMATDTALVEATAQAARMIGIRGTGDSYPTDWSTMAPNERQPKSYRIPPTVSLTVRAMSDLSDLHVVAEGTTDSYENDEKVRETWTFGFRDGSGPLVFSVDHSDRDRPMAVDTLCRHLARHI